MLSLIAALAFSLPAPLPETPTQRDARLKWWREARFGMFVHWGLYAIPAREWKGKTIPPGGGEWIMYQAQIPVRDYEPLAKEWNPTAFDARQWVGLAKEAGMKYLVVTSKHHDGFGLWPSRQSDWNVGRTPFKRDVLKELAKECKRQGVRLCFYHSIMDWHHADYLPKRPWDREGEARADFDRYVAYMKGQLKELLTEYGDIGILWFDGEWEGTWTHERGADLYNFVRALQPKIIINNRVSKGRSGMQGMTQGDAVGDYGTPEQNIPANGLPGVDWESCMTMNGTWGYRKDDHDWKSASTLIRNLIDCASKGGNYLLNVGPKADGTIPAESVERLREVGRWTKANGAAIYGSSAGPFARPLPWGRVTRKGDRLYAHVFTAEDSILLPGLRTPVVSAKTLLGGRKLAATSGPEGVRIDLRGVSRDPNATVIQIDLKGRPEVVPVSPEPGLDGALDLRATEATLQGDAAHLEGDHVGFWTDPKDVVSWNLRSKGGRFEVEVEYACEADAEGATFAVEVGGKTVAGKVESTGGWGVYRRVTLGSVDLAPGETTLKVRPATMPKYAVMNLRSVRLISRSRRTS